MLSPAKFPLAAIEEHISLDVKNIESVLMSPIMLF